MPMLIAPLKLGRLLLHRLGGGRRRLPAGRKTNGQVIQALTPALALWGGSADLSGSINVTVPGTAVSATNPGGDFIHFGIREHAMAAILKRALDDGQWIADRRADGLHDATPRRALHLGDR